MKRVKVETFQSKNLHYVNILPYLVVQNIYPECYYPYRKNCYFNGMDYMGYGNIHRFNEVKSA